MQNHSIPYWITREDKSIVYRATELEGFNTENKKLNQSLANEDGQNRYDARTNKNQPVIVKISEQFVEDKTFFDNFLKGALENIKINKTIKSPEINQKKIKLLKIECFNTNGLTGSFDKQDNDNYVRFFLGSAESKTGSQGGRRQLGRHTYMLASKLSCMFALSVEKNNNKEFLRGLQYLGRFQKNGKNMDPYSMFTYGKEDKQNQNEDETLPILDENIINNFKLQTGIKRKKNETGLSIIIPEPITAIKAETIFKNYIKRFYPSILIGNFQIIYDNKTIDSSNIENFLIEENYKSKSWLDFLQNVYTAPDDIKHYISKSEDYNYKFEINKNDFSEEKLKKIKEDYFNKKNIILKFHIKIPFQKVEKQGEFEGFFHIALKKKDYEQTSEKPLFLRGNLQIPGEANSFKYYKNCYAMLWSDDENLSELLGDSEGMAHDTWNSRHSDIDKFYDPKKILNVFKYVKSALSNIYTIITDKENNLDLDTFSEDLPTIEDIFLKEEKIETDVIKFDDTDIVSEKKEIEYENYDRANKMVKEIPVLTGFKIVKTEHCLPNNFPMKVRVKFAYRARGKNSFTCYDPILHFNLKEEKNVKISLKKNIEIIDQTENSINFIALAPDFEIEISNFKDLDKKDLDVRARKLKG